MEKIRIRDKHPGSAAMLPSLILVKYVLSIEASPVKGTPPVHIPPPHTYTSNIC
jgi:hypothetical protein